MLVKIFFVVCSDAIVTQVLDELGLQLGDEVCLIFQKYTHAST